ncbi:MAG: soluble lytic murein transglycosylase [Blastocatellia bacterium]|nr:soluble lytic murein transglycosylase [Blastocatellia bacterium]
MLSKRVSLASVSFILLLAFAGRMPAQTPLERHEKIRASLLRGDREAALTDLQAMRASEPSVYALNDYDYLLARLSQKRGDVLTAAISYQLLVARNSRLSQYALWHLAQLARATGNLTLEREHLRRLLTLAPESLLREAAQARLAQSFFESGDDASVIATLRPRSNATGGASGRAALALMGQSLLRSGQPAAAREAFNSLVTQLPDPRMPDDYALAGARGLDQLDNGGNTQTVATQTSTQTTPQQAAPQLPEHEHLRRALIYNFNRDFAGARMHYAAIIEHYPQSASVPDALYQTGRTYVQEGRFDEAIAYFKRVLDQYSESGSARDALSQMASAYSRTKRADEAITAYQRFIARYPDAPNPERSYLNIIDALRDAGRDAEALDMVQQTRARFKGQAGAALALFSQAKIHLVQNSWAAALADIDALQAEADLGGARLPGGTGKTELVFTRAYTLEQMGRTEDALNAYLSIPDGRNEYYGGRATRRLRALAANERTRNTINARLESLRASAKEALAQGQAENARQSAQNALRLTDDANITSELLNIVRRAYSSLPAYSNFPTASLLPEGRQLLAQQRDDAHESATPLTHQALADELLFLGLYDEGTPELSVALNANASSDSKKPPPLNRNKSDQTGAAQDAGSPPPTARPSPVASPSSSSLTRETSYTLAVFFKRGEHANHAVRFAEPLWKTVPADYLLELAPREMVELLYPAPYADALLQNAPQKGVDPRFILAIARQESRFQPEAKSVAAARGLLQFIPSTAQTIAAQLGRREFQQDELYDPRTAILFGAQYMGNLFKQFPDMPQAVAASYNGGEDNIARWAARARSNDPDRYVLEIGFTQSKDYVFKVLPNYWTYQTLYNEQLQPK